MRPRRCVGTVVVPGVGRRPFPRRRRRSRLMPSTPSAASHRPTRVLGLALATAGLAALVTPALAHASTVGDAVDHSYRHGIVPTIEHTLIGTKNGTVQHAGIGGITLPFLSQNLTYGGGTSGVGVTTGAPKVYLVFWGSQWGSPGTDASGYTTLSGDAK